MIPGIYHLIIYLPQNTIVSIGKLGTFKLPVGYYVYTGSALRGLEARISRHFRRKKRFQWHIDYLLEYGQIAGITTYQTIERLECSCNQKILMLPGCEIPIKGFGSSDCKCVSHLAYFEKKPCIYRDI